MRRRRAPLSRVGGYPCNPGPCSVARAGGRGGLCGHQGRAVLAMSDASTPQTGRNRRTPACSPRKRMFLPLKRNCKIFLRALAFKLITQVGNLSHFSIISSQLEKWLLFFIGLCFVHCEAESPKLPLARHGRESFVFHEGKVSTPPLVWKTFRRPGQCPARSPWCPPSFQLQFLRLADLRGQASAPALGQVPVDAGTDPPRDPALS